MPDKNSLREKISGFCKENLPSLEETTAPVEKTDALLSNAVTEYQELKENTRDASDESQLISNQDTFNPNNQENILTTEEKTSLSSEDILPAMQESVKTNQPVQDPYAVDFDKLSIAQSLMFVNDPRRPYIRRPVFIQGLQNCACIQVRFNPSPEFILVINNTVCGNVIYNENNELVFCQDDQMLGIITEWQNGWLRYIPYSLYPQKQASYPNQTYDNSYRTSYNFNINNIPANPESIGAVEKMLSSIVSNIPQTAKEVNVDLGFSSSNPPVESTVIDATLSDSNYTTLPFQKQ